MSDKVRDRCFMSTDGKHNFTFDSANSDRSTYCCSCGEIMIEYEDAGTGA